MQLPDEVLTYLVGAHYHTWPCKGRGEVTIGAWLGMASQRSTWLKTSGLSTMEKQAPTSTRSRATPGPARA